jgi:CO/xanthine dehydrogenase Mo-binding subunit
VGEPSINAAAPAVVNAIADAVGVRINHIPATAERIYFAMKEAKK